MQLHELNFERTMLEGPSNHSEAFVLAVALVETAPSPELEEIAKGLVAEVAKEQFPAVWSRFRETGKYLFTEEEKALADWLQFVGEQWADAMLRDESPQVVAAMSHILGACFAPPEVPES